MNFCQKPEQVEDYTRQKQQQTTKMEEFCMGGPSHYPGAFWSCEFDSTSTSADSSAATTPVVFQGPSQTTSRRCPLKLSETELIRVIGTGTFGEVRLVKGKETGEVYALKVMQKTEIVRLRQIEHVQNEKNNLSLCADCPFVVHLLSTWHDATRIYLLMEFIKGGELFRHLRRAGRFPKEHAIFYAAEVVSALEYLHSRDIVYRDIKPENILLDERGHVRLIDFGFSKKIKRDGRTWTLCGTPEYLSPETIEGSGHNKGVDWWALGILIYEMIAGYPPFLGSTTYETYAKILECSFTFPPGDLFDSPTRDIVKRLLERDKSRRLGCLRGGADDIKRHEFFKGIDWGKVFRCELIPPIIPLCPSSDIAINFDQYPSSQLETEQDFNGDLFDSF